MNNKQKKKLYGLFKEQQKLNLILFGDELRWMDNTMDYKGEKLRLELSIHESKNNLKFMKDQFASLNKGEQK